MTDYLTIADMLAMHAVLIERYGGSHGVRDMGALEAAVFRPQTGYYDDIVWEAAALMESIAMNHPFIDGNKRVAFASVDTFLSINGYRITQESQTIYQTMMNLFEKQQFELSHLERWLRSIVKEA